MSAERWGVEEYHEFPEWGEILTWPSDPPLRACVADVEDENDPGAIAAYAALVADVRAAARLRSLAALFEQPLNRDQEHTFTGHALAEMLRGEG